MKESHQCLAITCFMMLELTTPCATGKNGKYTASFDIHSYQLKGSGRRIPSYQASSSGKVKDLNVQLSRQLRDSSGQAICVDGYHGHVGTLLAGGVLM